jgi:hypothetical protein
MEKRWSREKCSSELSSLSVATLAFFVPGHPCIELSQGLDCPLIALLGSKAIPAQGLLAATLAAATSGRGYNLSGAGEEERLTTTRHTAPERSDHLADGQDGQMKSK